MNREVLIATLREDCHMSGGDWKEMYSAASSGNLELVKYHIKNGIDPNYQHPEILCTPLVASIIAGHDDIAKFLLSNGADANLRSEFDDMTPRQAAKRYKRSEILPLLGEIKNESWFARLVDKIRN